MTENTVKSEVSEVANGQQKATETATGIKPEVKLLALPENVMNEIFAVLSKMPWATINPLISEINRTLVEVKRN